MEITLLPKNSLRLKGKTATLGVDPQDKTFYNAALPVGKTPAQLTLSPETIVIAGAGEYEIGGNKIASLRSDEELVYTCTLDGVDIVLGSLQALSKAQNKLKDNNIVIVFCNSSENASFITSLASNVIILYGEKAEETARTFGKENIKTMNKYQTTKEKLPAEVETVLLASGV